MVEVLVTFFAAVGNDGDLGDRCLLIRNDGTNWIDYEHVSQALLVVAVTLALLLIIGHLWTGVFKGNIEGLLGEFYSWGMILLCLALFVLFFTLVYIRISS